ncbi:MAG: LAGLIDADG family homing endonuclease [Cellulosilyticaceae bacterium]
MLLNSDPIINKYISNNYITRIEKSYTAKGCKYYIENSILNIYQHLCDIGIYGQTQDNKRMPDNYLNLSKGHITNLLAGIFDTVCKISRCRAEISLTHSSLDLLKQVKFILRKLGVFGRISTIKSKVSHNSQDINKSYILFIRDIQSIYNFKQAVPIKVDYKINSLDKIVCKINKGSFSNGIRNAHVKSVEQIGVNRIYNLTANDSHTYIANDIITHNTGGDSDSKALQGLSEMFNNPKSYNVLPYKNRYSDDGEVQYTGFFLPAYSMMLKSGYVDNRGVTFLKKSRDYYEEARKNKSGQALLEYCAEYCFTPGEALLRQGDGIFDPILIADRLTQLRIQKIGITPQRVDLL